LADLIAQSPCDVRDVALHCFLRLLP
jgi:hypothetical protein